MPWICRNGGGGMTWTYSFDPSSSQKDAVRFLIGDTDTSEQLLQDEEIQYLINTYGNVILAASYAARAVCAFFARCADKEIGDYSIKASQKSEAYCNLAEKLEKEYKEKELILVAPYAGGISIDDKCNNQQDTDRVKPKFSKDQFDHPDIQQEYEDCCKDGDCDGC